MPKILFTYEHLEQLIIRQTLVHAIKDEPIEVDDSI